MIIRAFFSWLSKVIRGRFGFVVFAILLVQKKLPPLSQSIRLKTATNRDLVASLHFPALQAVCLGLLWVLIGCLSYLPLIWLALVITMVLIYNTWLKCALRFSGCFLLFFYLKEIIIIWVLNMNCFSYKFSECPKSWSQRQVGDKCNVTFWFSFSSFYSYFPLTI